MKKSLIFSMALAVMLAACDDESPSSSNPADSEIDSSSSVEETLSSSSVEQGSSSSKGVSSSSKEEAKSSSSVAEQESSSSKGVSSSSKEEAKSSSSVAEQKSSSSEKVPSSSDAAEESSSSEPGDTTTVNSSSSAEVVSSSSGPQELDVEVSTRCFADYPMGKVPTPATKAYMQPDSNGRYSGSLYYVVDNCTRLGGTLSKTMSGDTLVMKFVDVEESANCLCWSDFAISYGSELENIKYIDYTVYAKHSTYEVVHEPDPGKPSMSGSSSSSGGRDLLSSARAQQSSSSSD